MTLWGDITSAGESAWNYVDHAAQAASTALSNEAHTAMQAVAAVGDAEVKIVKAAGHEIEHVAQVAGKQVELFGEGVVTGALLNPINGVEQLVNHIAGTHLPPLEFSNQAEVNNSIAGKIGMVAGTVADFVLTDGAVSAVGGLEAGSALSLGITGAIQGGIFTPSDPSKTGGNFFLDRVENAAIDGVSFAAMGGVAGKVTGLIGDVGSNTAVKVLVSAESNAVGGAVGGAITAEGNALKQGRFATAQELHDQVGKGAAFGAAFGAAMTGLQSAVDAFRAPVQPGDALLPRVPRSVDDPQQIADLVDIRSDVSGRFFNNISKSIDDLPDSVRKLLQDSNTKIVLGGKITDYNPSLAGVKPPGWHGGTWDNAEGLFDWGTNEAVVAESRLDPSVNDIVRSTREAAVARHEIGHAVDHDLGTFSQSQTFQDAYQQDLAQIPQNLRARLDYYIQPSNPVGGAMEAFADLFASLHGGAANVSDTRLIMKWFPKTAEVIKQRIAALP
jgi:hypothetical protein